MAKLVAVGKWMSKWFTALVVLWAAVNYLVPQMSAWVIPNTSYLLGIILFGMGLTLTGADFKRIAQHPVPVVLGTLAHYVIMPGLAFLLCLVFHLKGGDSRRGNSGGFLPEWDFFECDGIFSWGRRRT